MKPAPAAPSGAPAAAAGPLARARAWIGQSLDRQLAFVTVVLALVVLVPATALSFTLSLRLMERDLDARLDAQAELHGARIAMAVHAARDTLADVAASPLLGTALVDAQGWQHYGAPFLRSLHIPLPVPTRLALCDFRGRVIAASGAPPTLAPLDWVEPVVERGEWRALVRGEGEEARLLLLAPVRYAGTGTVEGAVAAELPLPALAEHAFRGGGPARLLSAGGAILAGDRTAWTGRRWRELPVALPDPFDGLGLKIQSGGGVGQLASASAGLLLVHLAVAAGVLALGLVIARRMALRLTGPLVALAGSVEAISRSGALSTRAPVTGHDEVGRLAEGFNGMLARLEAAQAAAEEAHRGERREAEQALRLAHGALERSNDAISIDEASGRIAYVNEAACRLLGLPRERLEGRHTWEVDPNLSRGRWAQLWTLVQTAGRYTAERAVPNSGGPPRWIEVGVHPLRFGEADYCVSVMRDVTSRREAEAALRLAGVGTLAAGAAHEINNPLTSVMGNLAWLRQALEEAAVGGPAPDLGEASDAAREAYQASERVRDVVRGLKDFARPDEEPQEPTDLAAVVRGAVTLARHEVRHKGRLVERYGQAPQVLAAGRRLEQVLVNLLTNAAHALPDAGDAGEVQVSVGTTAEGEAFAEVRDNGSGMAPEVRSRVFEPFFTTKPVGAGTGLGLSICHGIVASFGGRIEVESAPGSGSAFRVVLPPLSSYALGGAPAAPQALPASPAGAVPPLPPGLRLLVVDDDRPVLRAVTRALGQGPEVVAIADPHEALRRMLAGERFDLVLCDVMMPGLSGMEIHAALLQARPALADRLVFMTGGAFTPRAREFLATLPNPCLDKPFEPEDLRRAVLERLPRMGAPA